MSSPSASVRVARSVLKTGARLVPVTVQVKPSVSVIGAVADGDQHGVHAGAGEAEGAADGARAGVDADARRQAGGAVGQRVAVGIGGVGVEAVAAEDELTLGVGAGLQVWPKAGARLGGGGP